MISRRDFLAGLAATAVLPLLAARAFEPDWTPREVLESQDALDRVAEKVAFGVDWGIGFDEAVVVRVERWADGTATVERVPEEQWRAVSSQKGLRGRCIYWEDEWAKILEESKVYPTSGARVLA